MAALASLMGNGPARGADRPKGESGLPGLPHFAPRARRVVVLWQGGGPSHVDLFDLKPFGRNNPRDEFDTEPCVIIPWSEFKRVRT